MCIYLPKDSKLSPPAITDPEVLIVPSVAISTGPEWLIDETDSKFESPR